MHYFEEREGELYAEGVPLARIAREVGTPVYVYSAATLRRHYEAFRRAFSSHPHLVAFSVKALSNIHILRLLGEMGSGADIVSGGELHRALKAGIPPERIVYSGVGKSAEEIRTALEAGILFFNCESLAELELIREEAARTGLPARISFRVNPEVDPKTHPYIATGLSRSKFGLPVVQAFEAYERAFAAEELEVVGIDCHIGSQLTELGPFIQAFRRLKELVMEIGRRWTPLKYVDVGGGLGIRYENESPPEPDDYARAVLTEMEGLSQTLVLEPGRAIAGNAGVLVTRVLYLKETLERRFVVVDAGMNDLARPSLYGAYHEIRPVVPRPGAGRVLADVVGPICESGDFLARDREIQEPRAGDLLAVMSAGAYGFTMASNYNSRPRAAEVLVDGDRFRLIRRRETYDDLIGPEERV